MNRKQWEKIITEWSTSGLSQAQFCREKGLAQSSFYNHKRRVNGPATPKRKSPDFVPVTVRKKPKVSAAAL